MFTCLIYLLELLAEHPIQTDAIYRKRRFSVLDSAS